MLLHAVPRQDESSVYCTPSDSSSSKGGRNICMHTCINQIKLAMHGIMELTQLNVHLH